MLLLVFIVHRYKYNGATAKINVNWFSLHRRSDFASSAKQHGMFSLFSSHKNATAHQQFFGI